MAAAAAAAAADAAGRQNDAADRSCRRSPPVRAQVLRGGQGVRRRQVRGGRRTVQIEL